MKPQITGITLAVKNLPLLKKFYTEVFGWDINMENEKILILQLKGNLLSLCREDLFTDYTGIATSPKNGEFYLTINLNSVAEVDDLFTELPFKGVSISKVPAKTFWGGYVGFVADPEGNLWEVAFNPML